MKYYLIRMPEYNKNEFDDKYNRLELTPDDYGLILDALYETRARTLEYPQEMDIYYAKQLNKVAKKFERIFNEEKSK